MVSKKRFYGKKSEKYCETPELIENYTEAINDKNLWECHHRLETHFSDGTPRPTNAFLRKEELIYLGMYFNRPAEELIFLTRSDHRKIHNVDARIHEKISNSLIGRHLSEETKEKIRKANLGKKLSSSEVKSLSERMLGNKITVGRKWFNNGIISVMRFECPDGFIPGRIYEPRTT